MGGGSRRQFGGKGSRLQSTHRVLGRGAQRGSTRHAVLRVLGVSTHFIPGNPQGRQYSHPHFFFVLIKKVVFIFERETEREQGRGREREGDPESEAGSRLLAVSPEPDARPEPMNHEFVT